MPKPKKVLCEMSREETQDFLAKHQEYIERPRFVCRGCVRVSAKKRLLCKPRKL